MSKLLKCFCAALFVVGLTLSGVGCAEKNEGAKTCPKTGEKCPHAAEKKAEPPCMKKEEAKPAAQPAHNAQPAQPAPQGEKK